VCSSVLQRVAVWCKILQCVAALCNVLSGLQCAAMWFIVLQRLVYCSVLLQCGSVRGQVLQRVTAS